MDNFNSRLVLSLKELKDLVKSVESFEPAQMELQNANGDEDAVIISIIKTPDGDLIYKIIH